MDSIKVKTFTPIYDEIEDRIRLIINIDQLNRVDLMITRAFIIKIIPLLEEFYEKHYKKFAEDKVKIENSSKKNDNTSNMTIVKIETELLMSINLTFNKKSKFTQIELIGQKRKVTAILNEDLMYSFIKLLKGAIPKFSWGLGFNF